MQEGFTEFRIEDAYTELRVILRDMKCQFLHTIPPNAIEARQGRWNGLTPVSMAKNLKFRLYNRTQGTQIESSAYWPLELIAAIIGFYSLCFFLMMVAMAILTNWFTLPLIGVFGVIYLFLFGLFLLLALLHIFCYLKRVVVLHQILNLLKVRGSHLHQRIKEGHRRKRQ
jgi:hypothetical protein